MSQTSQLRNKIAKLASELFAITIQPSHVAAEPFVIKYGSEKRIMYCVTVYDDCLNTLIQGGEGSYAGAFEDLHKKLIKEQQRRARESRRHLTS